MRKKMKKEDSHAGLIVRTISWLYVEITSSVSFAFTTN